MDQSIPTGNLFKPEDIAAMTGYSVPEIYRLWRDGYLTARAVMPLFHLDDINSFFAEELGL